MKNSIIITAAALLAAVTLFGCAEKKSEPPGDSSVIMEGSSDAATADSENEKNTLFGEFTASDISGVEATSDIFADAKISMVNVWATYCGPCIDEMPDLAKLSADYAEKGVQVIGIPADVVGADFSLLETAISLAEDIIGQTGADYVHIIPNEMIYKNVLADIYGVPTTYFLDSDGNLIGKAYIGARSYEKWADIIDGMLADIAE